MKRILYLIFLISILVSCEKEVHIPIEFTKSKLVVNALFNTDSLWNIEISASKYIYDTTEIPLINNAQVTVTNSKNNSLVLTNQGNGIYTSLTEKPEIGELYTLEVSHNDYENVSASNQLPGGIAIQNIDWGQQQFLNGELYRKINLTFQDNPEKEYYLVRVNGTFWEKKKDSITGKIDSILVRRPMNFFSQNASVTNLNSKIDYNSISFTDDLFNGNKYTFDILLSNYYFTDIFGKEDIVQTIYISLSRISKEYYWYETSYQAYLNASEGKFFSQPVQVYTNIENGLGIFAGFSTTIDTINIK